MDALKLRHVIHEAVLDIVRALELHVGRHHQLRDLCGRLNLTRIENHAYEILLKFSQFIGEVLSSLSFFLF